MNITTTAQSFDMTTAIDRFVRERLRSALLRLDADVMAIDVFLKDLNGPKGGKDKQVLIRVQLRNRQVVALETQHENLYAAIILGVKRTKRAIRRNLRKARHTGKRRLRDLLDGPADAAVSNT